MRLLQGPMLNPLTLKIGDKSEAEGTLPGNANKKIRKFKTPDNEDKINELSNKHFASESKKKMKWAVNMYVGGGEQGYWIPMFH